MGTGWKVKKLAGVGVVCVAVLCLGNAAAADEPQTQRHKQTHKKIKKPAPPPLPSGPTGPVQQIPLDSIAAVPPQVSYQGSQLTIIAPNSTLADILRAVRKQTGAEIEIPSAPERVVTHLGPGPARDVLADLLNGSRFNYVLLGAPGNEALLTRVLLVPKAKDAAPTTPNPADAQPGVAQATPPTPEQDASADNNDADQADDSNNGDDNADQPAEAADQPAAAPDQTGGVKTPQQMLQEMQQRQLQLQQQQPPGQPPIPGSGVPQQRPPQEQQ